MANSMEASLSNLSVVSPARRTGDDPYAAPTEPLQDTGFGLFRGIFWAFLLEASGFATILLIWMALKR